MTRLKTGIRRIDTVEGGLIAWLYGPTDLDDVMLALVQRMAEGQDGGSTWVDIDRRLRPGAVAPDFVHVDADAPDEQVNAAWERWRQESAAAHVSVLVEEFPTSHIFAGVETYVGWYRRFPWCNCGWDEHSWHYDRAAGPGRGASLAVELSWF